MSVGCLISGKASQVLRRLERSVSNCWKKVMGLATDRHNWKRTHRMGLEYNEYGYIHSISTPKAAFMIDHLHWRECKVKPGRPMWAFALYKRLSAAKCYSPL